jgi:hypothetical protein
MRFFNIRPACDHQARRQPGPAEMVFLGRKAHEGLQLRKSGAGYPLSFRESVQMATASLETAQPINLARVVNDLSRRVATLEARLTKRKPDTSGRVRTRRDRTPYGWKPSEKDRGVLVKHEREQEVIQYLIGLAQKPLSYREMARQLDAYGFLRRGYRRWVGAHGLVRSILRRQGIFTPADAVAAVQRRFFCG